MNSSLFCNCFTEIVSICRQNHSSIPINLKSIEHPHDVVDEVGRIAYTVAILLIFSLIIIILMFRSIKRSTSTVEMEALLDAMRFREELDLQQRQRRRLMKAKTKVTAWLSRSNQSDNNRIWKSSPSLMQIRKPTSSSIVSEVPEIVVTEEIHRAHTPALSLIYNFEGGSKRTSIASTRNSLFSSLEESSSSRKPSHVNHANSLPT